MADTYTSLYIHSVFSTKNRQPLISAEIQSELWPYIGGIAENNKMKAIRVGGVTDHLHILLSLPPTISVSKAIQLIKGNSSKWINEKFDTRGKFQWQRGYGAFTINISMIETTIRYINSQQEHHRKKSFQEEYIEFLDRHHIEYDERYVWN
jgi:REP element-mobilizing transposase RayT